MRQDTSLAAEGAEFLVVGHLLIEGVAAYKAYTRTPGYDVLATNPETGKAARIQVKSRWPTDAPGYIHKKSKHPYDFLVIALLNRGSKDGRKTVGQPKFIVLPARKAEAFPRTEKWGAVLFKKTGDLSRYEENWGLIREFLGVQAKKK